MTTNVLSAAHDHGADHSPGLFRRTFADGSEVVTNIRLAGTSRRPGSGLINFATGLLGVLGLGLFAVSVSAQFQFLLTERHVRATSFIEALAPDAALAIFSLLALGLARAGKSAKIERALVLVCALGSAGMNYAAANVLSPRSVVAYVAPPLLLAVVVDRVVAVVRRHVLGEDETSPFRPLGRAALYLLRLAIAPPSTLAGARRAVLRAAPVPGKPEAANPAKVIPATVELPLLGPVQEVPTRPVPAIEQPKRTSRSTRTASKARARGGAPSKTSRFIESVIAEHGELAGIDLGQVYGISKAHAPKVGLHEGSARTALRTAILRAQDGGAR
jgi:hypothetical protein